MNEAGAKKRLLIFIVAYNAEHTIQKVIKRIPSSLARHETRILVIDDSSQDRTFQRARDLADTPFPTTVLLNPVNQGYGGNQKIGFYYAIKESFDFVALLHGDGQYAPERLPDLLEPLIRSEADAVFGSRMLDRYGALKGGMPLYKFLGNKILTWIQNGLLKTSFSEFHSGYRIYSVRALKKIPFDANTSDFHFDTEIIIQLLKAGFRIRELPIPTYYGNEICHVNGLKYAWHVIKSTLLSRAQDLGILYQRNFDIAPPREINSLYQPKWGYESTHTLTLQRVKAGSKVLDVGCASGYLARALTNSGCKVTGIDQFRPPCNSGFHEFIQADLSAKEFPVDIGKFEYILLLDIVEHLRCPEAFVDNLRRSRHQQANPTIIVSTANIAFFITRIMLLLGYFHYGARGILDLTHTRLFTFATMRQVLEQAGYQIEEIRGVPAPYPLALGDTVLAKILLVLNKGLIRISRGLFSYQIFVVARPLPSLEWLLSRAYETSSIQPAKHREIAAGS